MFEIQSYIKVNDEFIAIEDIKGNSVYIAPPTKPYRQILDIKKISLRQKSLKCGSIPAFFFLDKFPFCLRLFGKV